MPSASAWIVLLFACGLLTWSAASCAGGSSAGGGGSGGAELKPGARWAPQLTDSFQYQLSGKLDTRLDADIFDIDLYETSTSDIDALHAQGRKVVCYFDTAYEPYRPDAKQLEPYRGGPIAGWPGQYWVDLREPAVVAVMLARLDMAQRKHCDGVEGDDVDARNNQPGFPLTAADQQAFIRKLAAAAHARGLAYGLKNDLDDVAALLDDVDFEVNEECFQYEECETLTPFVRAGKPVFNIEYSDGDLGEKAKQICPEAKRLGMKSLIKHIDLDAARYACP